MRLLQVMVLCGMALLAGCGNGGDKFKAKRPKTVPAAGKLTMQGRPLAEALVVLSPVDQNGVAAMARTDDEGGFILMAFPPDEGAVPGKYEVAVSMPVASTDAPLTPENHDAPPPKPKKPVSLIPDKYQNAKTSGITVTVEEAGSPELKIELK